MEKFTIEFWWKQYCKMGKLDENTMSDVQRQETRRAFYGAWGMLLVLMRDELSELSEEDAYKKLENFMNQVNDFWKAQA